MEMIDRTKECEASYMKSLLENQQTFVKSLKTKSIEDKLKELETTFRSPNILLETLNEMLKKHETNLEDIKLKLNEINQNKSNLNANIRSSQM
jgi:uncharacterized coiled-coil protein SlyX